MNPDLARHRTGGLRSRFRPYLVPAILAGLAGSFELAGDAGRLALRFDRAAIASGEYWRLLTAHLVHLGPSHLAMNVLALAILAFVLPALATARQWLIVSLSAAVLIDVGLYVFHPDVAWYVGLSGMLHGFWAAGIVLALGDRRFDALALALLLVVKLAYEAAFGAVPLSGEVAAGPVVTVAHAWGACGGTLAALGLLAVRRWRRWL